MTYDYGLWAMAALNAGLALAFLFAYLRPARRREWRSLGVLSAFIVALFTEMYGFPLTIYLLTALLGQAPFPNPFAHTSGNLIASLLGLGTDWAGAFMMLGGLLLVVSLIIVARAWEKVHSASGDLVTEGPYAAVRHPQYSGLMLGVVGALVQWPTLITLLMAPVLLVTYYRLARREERELEARFGEEWISYRARTPMFLPRWSGLKKMRAEREVSQAGATPDMQ